MIDLLPSAEQQRIVDQVASFLGDRLPYERFVPTPSPVPNRDRESFAALGELGVFGLGLSEALGGVGFGLAEEVLVAREFGRFLVSPCVLATMLAVHVAAHAGDGGLAQAIAGGERAVAAALAFTPDGADAAGEYHLVDAGGDALALVWTQAGIGLVEAGAWQERREVPSIDTSLTLERARMGPGGLLHWVGDAGLARGALLLASAYLAGIAEAAATNSVEYAKIRQQFGQPIGTFQAVKHRCADMTAQASAAWNLTVFAALTEIDGTADAAFQGIAAKLVAAQAAFRNAAVNIQNHGGIGFTGEHYAHLFVKRAHVLDRMGGDMAVQKKRMLQAVPPASDAAARGPANTMEDVTVSSKADEIATHFALLPTLEPKSVAVRFEGRSTSWGDLGAIADGIVSALREAGVPAHASIGWIARNDPALMGALIGLIKGRYTVSPVNPHQPAAKMAEQLRMLKMAAAVGVEKDFHEQARAALAGIGAVGVVLEAGGAVPVRLLEAGAKVGAGPFRSLGDEVVIERLTSGTTGEPKRIQVNAVTVAKALELGARSEKAPGGPPEELKVKRSPSIMLTTFSHSGGMWGALLGLNQARPTELFEKFEPRAWAEAVERGQVKAANLVPSMVAMIMEAGVPPGQLKSLLAIRIGTAPLDPEQQQAFEDTYHVPLLVEYSASEFMGGIAGWSLADHKEYGRSKRGAVGRLRPDMEVKITDQADDAREMPRGEIGVLNLKSPRIGPDFIKTTDLASYDAEAFLWIHGRADEAINRGGFKILPEKVAETLRMHAAVREVGVLAVRDARLGQVPIAVVETIAGGGTPTGQELKDFVRASMPAYMVPVAIEFVDALPRTLSMKVDRPALRAMLGDRYEF